MEWLSLTQWPAMGLTLLAAWWTGSQQRWKRRLGFGLFLASNVLWVLWGIQAEALALILLQIGLAFLNIRVALKNES